MKANLWLFVFLFLLTSALTLAQSDSDKKAFASSVQQLRDSVGEWETTTEFLNPDGTVAKKVTGIYRFEWVVIDRVLSGRSDIPELKMSSGILFYVNEAKKNIEMVSVGADGHLWVMTGPLGEEVRYTPKYKTQEGSEGQLRFTRYNVKPDSFESKMEYTEDSGKSWKPGNHQMFRRKR